jgi:hypothetical protein
MKDEWFYWFAGIIVGFILFAAVIRLGMWLHPAL